MEVLQHLEPWWRFALALLVGALIGLEREFVQQRSGDPEFAGIRTFSLMSLFGATAAFFSQRYGIAVFVAAYLGLVLLVWASYMRDVHEEEEGITTEVVALLVALLGAMIVLDMAGLAAALGVVSAFILALKPRLHDLARRMSLGDLRATLEFALITAVVLPLLPNQDFGPYGVLNLFEIWLLVVLVSGIGFVGYVLIKILGAERGIGLTGVLGGLVSSTAVTLSFAGRSKETPTLSPLFAIAILLASCIMFPRVLIEVLAVNASLLSAVGAPLGAMLIVGLAGVWLLWRRQGGLREREDRAVEFANPLKLLTAISFGVLFAVVLMVMKAASVFFGDLGVYGASALTALADVDALTLTAAELAASGQLDPSVASVAIVLGALVNTAVKAVTAAALGTPQLRRAALPIFGAILLTGTITGLVVFLR